MNKKAGSKKLITLAAAAGITVSRIIRIENVQNIPNSALGNLIDADTKACFSNLSVATIIPSETTKCSTPNT